MSEESPERYETIENYLTAENKQVQYTNEERRSRIAKGNNSLSTSLTDSFV